jgi:heme oxygenase
MTKTTGIPTSCPYASALSDDEDGSHSNDATSSRPYSPTGVALALARSKCPAFADGNQCPFRNATSAERLREVMEKVPPSHFPLIASHKNSKETRDEDTSIAAAPFQLAMEHVHLVSSELGNDTKVKSPKEQQYLIQGGCPFKSFHREHSSSESSSNNFVRAMEEYSVAYQIGRMVDSLDGDHEQDERNKMTHEGEERHSEKTSSLSDALKSGTAESHEAAENVHFVKNFIGGKIDRELYEELVTGLYHTYVCLESLLNIHGPKHFPSLHFAKELSRTNALKEDMEFWHGSDWESNPKCRNPSPAVRDYIDRMEEVGRMDPLLLLSHAYTRYLGDLSGGKVLSRIARRALNLDGYDGLRFYQFESIPSAVAFKKEYRTALDELALKPDEMGRLVAEANVAFALNMRVFEELDVLGKVPGARLRPVREALSYYDSIIDQQKNKNAGQQAEEAKCPFGFKEGPNPHNKTAEIKLKEAIKVKEHSSCPWPFVFFHDPLMGMKDWQTWFIIGIALCWCWSQSYGLY